MATILKVLMLWLIGAAAITIPLSRVNLLHYQRLAHGVRTNGVVTALEPDNHRAVRYSFSVADKRYSGVGKAGFGNPEFDGLSLGQGVIVYYISGNPDESCPGIPDKLIKNEIPPIILAGITFPAYALAVWSRRCAPFKRWLTS